MGCVGHRGSSRSGVATGHSSVSASQQDCAVLPRKTLLFPLEQHSVSPVGISGQAKKSSISGKGGEWPRAWDGESKDVFVFFLLLW